VKGKRRIIKMPDYTSDFPDMVPLAYTRFDGKSGGEFAFGCVAGAIYGAGDGNAIEFSWQGNDEMDEACGDAEQSRRCTLGAWGAPRGTRLLDQAVAAYREALKEYTRERVPLEWATAQSNLGSVLGTLGARESGTARLEEAVVACREALKERRRALYFLRRSAQDLPRNRSNQCAIRIAFMSFLHNASRFAESAPPHNRKGNSQNRPAAFLGALKGMRKKSKLTHSLTHTHNRPKSLRKNR
jgi:hypothetical protein